MVIWEAAFRRLAALPNTYVKLSGLPQSFAAPGWTADDFAPAVSVALDAFGARRLNYAGVRPRRKVDVIAATPSRPRRRCDARGTIRAAAPPRLT